jgi:AraC-like DNA-binding protein
MKDRPLAWTGPYCPFIHFADDAPRRRPWSLPQRRLEYWLLVTSVEGEERIVVDGQGYDVGCGDSYVIQPGRLHDLGSRRGSTPAWVHFDVLYDPRRSRPGRHHAEAYEPDLGERATLLQPDARALWGIDLPVLVPAALAPRFRHAVPALIARQREGGAAARLAAAAHLAGLLADLVAACWQSGEVGHDDEDRIGRAEAVARHRLDTDFGLEAFAAAAGLGRSRFCQLYRRIRGEPPGAFLQRERQSRAEDLLTTTDLPVGQIAGLVGYSDATVFVRAFRRSCGLTPGGWRAGQRAVSKPSR